MLCTATKRGAFFSAALLCALAATANAENLRIVLFGGTDAKAFAEPLRARLAAEGYPASVDVTALRLNRGLPDQKSGVVVLCPGVEDTADGPRVNTMEFRKHLDAVVGQLRAAKAYPILVTPATPEAVEYAKIVRWVALKNSAPVIDAFQRRVDAQRLTGAAPDDLAVLTAGWIYEQIATVFEPSGARRNPPRGFSIPLIDWAGDTARQVLVDREPGQYLGHPTTVLLEDGKTILCVYPKGHGRGAIQLKRSEDGGKTWSARLPVPENWATSLETPTIFRVKTPQDQDRFLLFSGLYPIRMSTSSNGIDWTPLAPIGDFGGIVALSCMIRLKDGRYMGLFHDDGRFLRATPDAVNPAVFQVYKTVSADGGLTWSPPEEVVSHPSAQLCEPGIVRSPDGAQLAVLLRENSRRYNSFITFSNDEGQTWSRPRELPGALTGDRHVAKYAPDGRLFITFRDMAKDSPTCGDWAGWVGTYEDLVAGREGQCRVRLMKNYLNASKRPGDCGYPGLELLPDGTFVTTTYGHWTEGEPPYVVSVRFTMDDLRP